MINVLEAMLLLINNKYLFIKPLKTKCKTIPFNNDFN